MPAPHAPRAALPAVAVRYAAIGAFAIGLAALHIRRPTTVCLLRATTGVPCPLCGGTTAVVRLGHGHVVDALRASPLAVGLVAWLPWVGRVRPPSWWQVRGVRVTAVAAVLIGAEVWQLLRMHLLGV